MGQNVDLFFGESLSLGSRWSLVKKYEPASTGTLHNGGYACIIAIYLFNLSKLWWRFSQLQNWFIKKNRTHSVFLLQSWLAYQNIAERIKNKNSALDFSFSSLFFFCNMDLKSNNFRKTTDLIFFYSKAHEKKFRLIFKKADLSFFS